MKLWYKWKNRKKITLLKLKEGVVRDAIQYIRTDQFYFMCVAIAYTQYNKSIRREVIEDLDKIPHTVIPDETIWRSANIEGNTLILDRFESTGRSNRIIVLLHLLGKYKYQRHLLNYGCSTDTL